MLHLVFARNRLRSFLDEIDRLLEAEFPYPHSEDALKRLHQIFKAKLDVLNVLDAKTDPSIVKQQCALTLRDLFLYLPIAGFILRSTNVRNAFEVFGPLLRLARDVLEPSTAPRDRKTKLIISSEWDYSPFIYSAIAELPEFVLIGMPAPESSNPLLLPLAGHELGHSVWAASKLGETIKPLATKAVLTAIRDPARWKQYELLFPNITAADLTTDLFAIETWSQAAQWTLRQAEESFCDFTGLRIFGSSYLNAFAYLLSPNIARPSSVSYPKLPVRVANLIRAAAEYSVDVPHDYASQFQSTPWPQLTQGDEFRAQIAENALTALVDELIASADRTITLAALPAPSGSEVARITSRFKYVVPAEHCKSLVDILNAAWEAFKDPSWWHDTPQVFYKKEQTLAELVLKNIEVFEIEHIVAEA